MTSSSEAQGPASGLEDWRNRQRSEVEQHRIEMGMAARLARAREIPKHPWLPLSYLVPAAIELRSQFVDGDWYSCILLALGLADGMTKHVAEREGLDPLPKADALARAAYLQTRGALSPAAYAACVRVWGDSAERGHYMHFNPQMETDPVRLEARAREGVFGLHQLQADLFGADIVKGNLRPHHPKLWPPGTTEETTSAFLDFT